MGGLDAIIFTAGVGENSPEVGELTCQGLGFLGIELDKGKNETTIGKEVDISSDNSRVRVLAIPTNEELVIARDTKNIVDKKILH